jgi:general secretion pathway protein G
MNHDFRGRHMHKTQAGFTLVELLIVAIILAILAAILAAIVVPQFASTTTDAQESALRSNLSAIRAAADLYRQQHGEYPGELASTGGAGGAGTAPAFSDQLLLYTDANGASCSQPNAGLFQFGPYLKEDVLPTNPVTNVATLVVGTDPDLNMLGDGAAGGWKFSTATGKFIANDTNTDSAAVRYDSY